MVENFKFVMTLTKKLYLMWISHIWSHFERTWRWHLVENLGGKQTKNANDWSTRRCFRCASVHCQKELLKTWQETRAALRCFIPRSLLTERSVKSETRLVALRSWISYTAAHSCNKHLREGGAGRPGLDAATDLCDLQPAVQAAGEEGGGEKRK